MHASIGPPNPTIADEKDSWKPRLLKADMALTCLRRSVDKMHAFEQGIATGSSQVMGLIEDDIGAGEPGVVADMAGATTKILNQVASDINALQATVPAG